MNAVGIDVSKGKSMVAVIQPLEVVAVKPFEVQHTAEALENLGYSLKEFSGETRVIMEHTGRYYEPVAQALHERGCLSARSTPCSSVNTETIHSVMPRLIKRTR